ncbi:DUF427-domain-containing protein [Armillaria luteobubalina]|uniref:DUF427-domain-containing protein n=1 Tax=Armillaria luteobubalina TaxID=153913 RepID=A0AA39QKF6_9AGAR|nr:DUF427-domain-containing protein [Armillaria luteobubalina]
MKVSLNGTVLAESNDTVVVENNHYFPPSSVKTDLFADSKTRLVSRDTSSVCPWKGTAAYYNANVDGKEVKDIAWYYPNPSDKAKNITNYVAFYKVGSFERYLPFRTKCLQNKVNIE